MDKKRLEIILTSVLIPICIVAWIVNFNLLRKKAGQKNNSSAVAAAPSVFSQPAANVNQAKVHPKEDAEWLRDPFSGKVYSKNLEHVVLSGIMWDAKGPLAMINNSVTKVGDEVGQYTVLEIKQNSVILTDGSKDLELRLGEIR